MNELNKCMLCPRECKINRNNMEVGLCGETNKIRVARISLHHYEEPPISGTKGSGTIFFSGCNMKCIFCQNYEISTKNFGEVITVTNLANKMLELQQKGAHNINLVTPTHFSILIIKALKQAKQKGLKIPIIYNTSGYEKIETLKLFDGLIDIYMPDLKYFDDFLAMRYSKAPNYFEITTNALNEMYKQVGRPKFDKKGIMQKGIIVRHLLLPGQINDSKEIIKYLYEVYKDNIFISIMNQYTPTKQVKNINELNKKVSKKEYNDLIDYACKLNITNAFIQDDETAKESFIPKFDLTGVK